MDDMVKEMLHVGQLTDVVEGVENTVVECYVYGMGLRSWVSHQQTWLVVVAHSVGALLLPSG